MNPDNIATIGVRDHHQPTNKGYAHRQESVLIVGVKRIVTRHRKGVTEDRHGFRERDAVFSFMHLSLRIVPLEIHRRLARH